MLYKFNSAPTAEETLDLLQKIVKNQTLKASDPTTFNDPFEFKVGIDVTADDDTAKKRYLSDRPQDTEEDFARWWRGLRKPTDWYINQEIRKNLLSTVGVCCFSKNYSSHLMWSHYASHHTGFCVGYDDAVVFEHSDVSLHGAVSYEIESPMYKYFDETPEAWIHKAMFFKSKDWAYEDEVRVVFNKPGLIHLGAGAVREIILGCRAASSIRKYTESLLQTTGFSCWQMAEANLKYSLARIPIKPGISTMTSTF